MATFELGTTYSSSSDEFYVGLEEEFFFFQNFDVGPGAAC